MLRRREFRLRTRAHEQAHMGGLGQNVAIASALVEALPDPVVVVDMNFRVAAVNKAARAFLPTLRAGEPFELALRAPEVLDCVRRVSASGKTEIATWRDRVPVERVFQVHVAPFITNGRATAVVITLRDLTEARSVERMRVDFVANASHELRTPLATLLGFVETLQGPARDDAPARDRFLAIMQVQARRMARLLDDLLSLSRIEQNRHLKPEAPVDLALVARHLAETLTRLAQESGLTLVVVAPDPVVVAGDRDEIVRVAENLIENALKYGAPTHTANKAQVEIQVAAKARQGILSVRDHGPGIAPEHLPRLTERFYRVDSGESRAKGGTGLGLAIVKHIVARHRGRLMIDSRIGEGATFSAAFPLYK